MSNHFLMHFRESETESVKRLDEFAKRAYQSGRMMLTAFLSPRDLEIAAMMASRNQVQFTSFGGYPKAERERVLFFVNSEHNIELANEFFEIVCLKLISDHREKVRHQDYLGSILGMGVQLNQIGDIVIDSKPGNAYVFVSHQMALYFIDHYTHAGKVPVKVESLKATPDISGLETKWEERLFTLKSLRLDAFIASAFGHSRTDAAQWIKSGKVQLNYSICEDITEDVTAGDVISMRGTGRVRILSIEENPKSGRQFVRIGKYN